MLVTINVDASYHPIHKVGAFAFWIVCDQGKIMQLGALKECKQPRDAELMGICNALHVLLKSNFTGVTKVIINNDCTHAHIRVKKKSDCEYGRKAFSLLKKIKVKYEVFGKPIHQFRHVKAHSGTETKRQWVNDWCDKKAKEALWSKINSK